MTSGNDTDEQPDPAGKWWAYTGITVGAAISIYANVAEKFVHYDATTKTWLKVEHPPIDGMALAAVAPVILFIMSELFVRVRRRGPAAWTVRGTTVAVALVAFGTSFQHLRGLLLARGETDLTAWTYPLGIDGLMVGATAVLWQIRTARSRTRSMDRSKPGNDATASVGDGTALHAVPGRPEDLGTASQGPQERPSRKRVAAARTDRRPQRGNGVTEAPRPDVTDLLEPGRDAADAIRQRGETVTWRGLQTELTAAGVSAGTARVQELRRQLAQEPATATAAAE